jgi:uncharacterized coiled-coil protein SlyX
MASTEVEERHKLAEGGIWTDENLDQGTDWKGETGSEAAAEDAKKVHLPQSGKRIEEQILQKSGVTSDVLNTIVRRVESALLKSSGSGESSLLQMMEKALAANSDKISDWLRAQEKRVDLIEKHSTTTHEKQIEKLDERIALLEQKIDVMIGSMTAHGAEEARMIKEAYDIIKNRQAVEESDVQSEPSVIQRMETRVGELSTQLQKIEPIAAAATIKRANESVNRASIFKKMNKRI